MKKVLSIVSIVLVISVLLCVLCACNPKSAFDGKEKLEKKGYEVETITANEISAEFGFNLKTNGGLLASKGDDGVMAIWFEDKKDAEDFESMMNLAAGSLGESFGIEDAEYGVKKNIFYLGTKKAVNDLF